MLRGRQILSKDRGKDRIEDDSPRGIALRANNSILVESVFHGAKDAKFKQICEFEARNPKYETNYNDGNTNVQNS